MAAPERILVVIAAGLGDFIFSTVALRAIRERFPRSDIWLLTIPEVQPLAERCPYVSTALAIDLRHSRSALKWALGRRSRELWRLLWQLRRQRFDLAINLYGLETVRGALRMAAFLRLMGARCTAGRWSRGCGFFYDLASREEGHEVDAQLAVARLLGAPRVCDVPELWVRDDDRRACASLLEDHGIPGRDRLVCLHAGSARPEARWPQDRFAEVGQRLAGEGARVLLIGGPSDRELCASLADAIPKAISLAGETSLPVLAALLERAALLVTNDSGPMHMGAALHTPLVAPFGPADSGRFGPRGKGPCRIFTPTGPVAGGAWWEGVPAEAVGSAAVELFRMSRIGRNSQP